MGHRPFSKPLHLRLRRTGNYQARSAWEALEYLELYWDAPKDEHYRKAQKLCQNAIDGWTTAEKARDAVEIAARRAGVLAEGRSTDRGRQRVVYRPIAQNPEAADTDLVEGGAIVHPQHSGARG
ncbi:MAG TPA: DUF982 domain-containing protein [Devosiaceae bacterium]|jgi:hypothetical protein|nr:DUF982 domain-containing protein [Devosiaceae bacterium]